MIERPRVSWFRAVPASCFRTFPRRGDRKWGSSLCGEIRRRGKVTANGSFSRSSANVDGVQSPFANIFMLSRSFPPFFNLFSLFPSISPSRCSAISRIAVSSQIFEHYTGETNRTFNLSRAESVNSYSDEMENIIFFLSRFLRSRGNLSTAV